MLFCNKLCNICHSNRMERSNTDSFLEEFSPLSEALIAANLQNTSISSTLVYATIGAEKSFQPFASKFLKELEMLDYPVPEMKFVEWKHFAIFNPLHLITPTQCPLLRKKINYFRR